METSIGLDVGGTSIKGGIVDADGNLVEHRRWPSAEECQSEDGIVRALVQAARELDHIAPAAPVGIGVAGLVDGARGIVRESPNFPQWRDLALVSRLQEAGVEARLAIDNDANAAALGEVEYGRARGLQSFVFLTLGTGVGGAVYLGGDVWRGKGGFAGELGHMVVVPQGRRCGCGSRGCLEQYASLNGLRQSVLEHALEIDGAEELATAKDLPEQLASRAHRGDEAALACFHELGFFLGLAISSLLNALDVERVILGGGVAEAIDLFRHTLVETVSQHTFAPVLHGVAIEKSALGPRAGIFGAAALGRRLKHE